MQRRELENVLKRACRMDVVAFKPGNVSLWSAGHGMCAEDFLASAEVAVPALCAPEQRCGARIRAAVSATMGTVGCNTNLGILLLLAPLAAAAQCYVGGDLRRGLGDILGGLTVEDAGACFEAICIAKPAGLGRSEQADVHAPATIDLRAAMNLAADRDLIARQYTDAYGAVFELGVPTLIRYRERWRSLAWAATQCYLDMLTTWPDSHVERKHGRDAAEALSEQGAVVASALKACENPRSLLGELRRLDRELKAQAINPGTSADLTVASVAVLLLLERL